jgi:hypothetical protein
MVSEVVRGVAGRRFAAEAPGLPGVIAYGEMAAEAQMRAAVVALRVMVLRKDGPGTSACVPAMAPAVWSARGVVWRTGSVGRYVAVRGVACLAAAWPNTAAGCALSDPTRWRALPPGSYRNPIFSRRVRPRPACRQLRSPIFGFNGVWRATDRVGIGGATRPTSPSLRPGNASPRPHAT